MLICERCKKEFNSLNTHHLIPRWLTKESDTLEVCSKCHGELEAKVVNFVRWGKFTSTRWYNKQKHLEGRKRYRNKVGEIRKHLFSLTLIPYVYYRDYIYYHMKEDKIIVSHNWFRSIKGKYNEYKRKWMKEYRLTTRGKNKCIELK